MDRLKYLLGLVFACSLGLFFRFSLFGYDSYATALCVRDSICSGLNYQPGALVLFGLMPFNLLVFKIIMFLCLFVSVLVLWKLVNALFDERTAWLSILVLFASTPFMLFEFGKFENEIFAFPLILFGIYLLFIKKWYFFVPFVASLVFWLWPGYILLNFFSSPVLELQFFSGVQTLFFGFVFLILFFLVKDRWVLFFGGCFLGVGLLSSHLTIFLIPLIVIGIGNCIRLLSSKGYDTKNLILPCVILILCFNIAFFLAVPTNNEWVLVDKSITLSKDTNFPLYNDWSFGHWLRFQGQDTNFRSGGNDPNYFELEKPFIALTDKNLYGAGCNHTENFDLLTRSVIIWRCE